MSIYIIKIILTSSLLYLFFHLMLEKERMHRFKRVFLLFAPIVSLIIPLIYLPQLFTEEIITIKHIVQPLITETVSMQAIAETSILSTSDTFMAVSAVISIILLLRMFRNIYRLVSHNGKKNEKIGKVGYTIILNENTTLPHSFWNRMFLNKSDYNESKIDKNIILHELEHIKQKHSLDVLLIELIVAICWFNPAFYFFRKAIKLNHEF